MKQLSLTTLICSAILLVCLITGTAWSQSDNHDSETDSILKVMTWNILNGGDIAIKKDVDRRSLLISFINEQKPDILLINEADGWHLKNNERMHIYEKAISMTGHIAVTRKSNVVIFTNPAWKIESVEFDTENFFHALIDLQLTLPNGKSLRILGAHLDPFSPKERTREVRKILSRFKKSEQTIILGDMNNYSSLDNCTVSDIPNRFQDRHVTRGKVNTRPIDLIYKAGFVDAFRQTHPETKTYTVPTTASIPQKSTFKGARIDYILVSPELAPDLIQCDIIQNEQTCIASDHYPVTALFKMPLE